MLYYDFSAGGKQYKLRLNTRATIGLEKALDGNPLEVFTKATKDEMPKIEVMTTVLFYSLSAYHSEYTLEDAYSILDAWLDDGNSIPEFLAVIVEIYKASGLIKAKAADKKN